jgi:hypothetical protein
MDRAFSTHGREEKYVYIQSFVGKPEELDRWEDRNCVVMMGLCVLESFG